jgi:UDP-N-acetylglucosamine 2-epimerase (non-hydrolysing)
MKRILIVFGTRPEAIKLAPVIKALKGERSFNVVVCSTGQHDEMLKQVINLFKINIDFDLSLMKKNQDLFDVTSSSINKLKSVFKKIKPDLLVVQGDTTTAFVSSLAAFYLKIKVAHVEAGLRSRDTYNPYPEEVNRKIISVLANLNFAPTNEAMDNLISEGIHNNKIFVTGNTVIDALLEVEKKLNENSLVRKTESLIINYINNDFFEKEFILITMHRREKFGEKLKNILHQLKEMAEENKKYNFVYPVHLNPNVKRPVQNILSKTKNFKLLPPLDYLSFTYLMSKCRFIISDSGGIQEECFVFKKPIIVLRDVTEREEALKAGYAFLAGKNKNVKEIFYKIDKKVSENFNFFKVKNPFGDGKASGRIVKNIKQYFNQLDENK